MAPINTSALEKRIKEKHIKKKDIAESLGISKESLKHKIHNKTEFKISEIAKLADLLELPVNSPIFFG